MVATLNRDAPPDFSPYSTRLDTAQGGVEDGPGSNRLVPTVHHEAFRPRRYLTPAQRKEFAVKQAAIRLAAGLEPRSLRAIAATIGCSHNTVYKAFVLTCDRLGLHKFIRDPETRAKLRAARARQIAEKRQPTSPG